MAVRTAMTALIASVRDLTGDVGESPMLTDQQVQDKLDESRQTIRYELLLPAPMISNDVADNPAVMVWIEYFSQHKYWEVDEIVQDAHFVQLTPIDFEPIVGRFVMSFALTPGVLPPKSESPAQLPPVWCTGKVYDINKAAYKCLSLMIALLARTTYNFTADGQTISRAQIITNLQSIMKECARNIKPRTILLERSDGSPMPGRELLRIGGEYGTSGW